MAYNVLHMGSDKRIPCSEETFETLSELKESRGDTWDQLLLWLYEDARDDPLESPVPDVDEWDIVEAMKESGVFTRLDNDQRQIMNRLDELPEETARKTEERVKR